MKKISELKEQQSQTPVIISSNEELLFYTVGDHVRGIIAKADNAFLAEIEWMITEEKAKRLKK